MQTDSNNDYSLTDSQQKLVILAITTTIKKAVVGFKPTKKYLLIEDYSSFWACIAFVAQKEGSVAVQLNPIGHRALESMEEQERCTVFGRKLKYYMGFFHQNAIPITHLSPEIDRETIDADDLWGVNFNFNEHVVDEFLKTRIKK